MKIRLLDWECTERFCDIPDDTESIVIEILSGDMVMIEPFRFDSSNDRELSYYDGTFRIYKKDFDILNTIKESYDIDKFNFRIYDYYDNFDFDDILDKM